MYVSVTFENPKKWPFYDKNNVFGAKGKRQIDRQRKIETEADHVKCDTQIETEDKLIERGRKLKKYRERETDAEGFKDTKNNKKVSLIFLEQKTFV